jgi:hypothetical protein
MRNKRWSVARSIMSVVMLVVALPIYLHNQGSDPSPPPVPAATAQHRTQVNHYETPCDYRERMARGIPAYSVDTSKGLMAYVRAHLVDGTTPDAELADYWAALDACDANEPVAKWNWEGMILTHAEFLPLAS